MIFEDRTQAGRLLAQALLGFKSARPVVLGLPRGGVVVAREVARALAAPLDIWLVGKVRAPGHPELGLGAVAEGGTTWVDPELLADLRVDEEDAAVLVEQTRTEVARKVSELRRGRPRPELTGRTVIVVDDGVAMGGTARAVLRDIERLAPERLIFAIPVASTHALQMLRREADEVICLEADPELMAISAWYEDFHQVSTDECLDLLRPPHVAEGLARTPGYPPHLPPALGAGDRQVMISTDDADLPATFHLPRNPLGVVIFAHGSGSSRFSTRNNAVARRLHQAGLGTLQMDLLTEYEQELDARDGELQFAVDLLADRLLGATTWVSRSREAAGLPRGYFGSSTGAAAAIAAASQRPDAVSAIVCRGGRPDLAVDLVPQVQAPTLLIVGGEDPNVLGLNRRVLRWFTAPAQLVVVPGATHLFEEPGALAEVARLAGAWFTRHFGKALERGAHP